MSDVLMFLSEFNTATDMQDIEGSLHSLCQLVGIDHFRLMVISPSSIQRPDVQILDGCPCEWGRMYRDKNFWAIDPLVRKGMRQSIPILWADLINECREQHDLEGENVMLQAEQFGLRDGVTFPWHGVHGHVGLLSFATRSVYSEDQWLSVCHYFVLLVAHLFEAVSRICVSDSAPRYALSLREREVCQWAAEGKQVSDIGKILGITPRTVTFHLNRIIEKFGASNKNQAISWALAQGVVKLNVKAARVEYLLK